jgi:hypothetical protein
MRQRPEHEAPGTKDELVEYLRCECGDDSISVNDLVFAGCARPRQVDGYAWYWRFTSQGETLYGYICTMLDGETMLGMDNRIPPS